MQLVLLRAIRELLQTHFGDTGAGALGGSLAVRYYSSTTHVAIIRCARLGVQQVWAALTMCNELAGRPARISVKHCGGEFCVYQEAFRADFCTGTIRKVQQVAIKLDAAKIRAIHANAAHISSSSEQPLDSHTRHTLETSKRAISAIQI